MTAEETTGGPADGPARSEGRRAAPGRRTVMAGALLGTLGAAGLVARPARAVSRRASGPGRGAAQAGAAGVTATPLRTADGSLWLEGSFSWVTRSGLALGSGERSDGRVVSAVWTRRHGVVELFASAPEGEYRAVRINELGSISGYHSPGGAGPTTAMLWGPEGSSPREIGGRDTKAGFINNHGQALVNHDPDGDPDQVIGKLFLHSPGSDQEIVMPVPPGSYPQALALTDSGHVIGYTWQYNPPNASIGGDTLGGGSTGGTSGGGGSSGGTSGGGGGSGGTSTSGGGSGGASSLGGASGSGGAGRFAGSAGRHDGRDLAPDGDHQRAMSFHWYRGLTTDLTAILGGQEPFLRAVNNSGLVTGQYGQGYETQVFLWKDGRTADLVPGHPFTTMITGSEQVLNDRGDIVGACQPQWEEPLKPFLYTGGRLTVLPVPDGCAGYANAVSSSGDLVAGSCMTPDGTLRACLWRGGRLFDLGVPDGCTDAEGQFVTDRGEVFGYALSRLGEARHLYRWTVA